MKSRLFLLVSFLLLLNLIRCGCPDAIVYYFNWNGCKITHEKWVLHEGGYWKGWPSEDTVFYGATFGVDIALEMEVIAKHEIQFDFSNSAYATEKCDPDVYVPKTKIVGFAIYTLNDFDDGHLMNTAVTDYFLPDNFSVPNFISYLNFMEITLDKSINCRLKQMPTKGTAHKFKIEFVLEDGTKLTKETKAVTLLPEK